MLSYGVGFLVNAGFEGHLAYLSIDICAGKMKYDGTRREGKGGREGGREGWIAR